MSLTDETLRLFLAALGRALTEAFGEPKPVVKAVPAEGQPQKKLFNAKIFTCADCGRHFEANAPHANRCEKCRIKHKLDTQRERRAQQRAENSAAEREKSFAAKAFAPRGGDVNLWDGPAKDADMVYGNSIDM